MNEAKALFFKYGGRFFYMDREGEYEQYRRYGVTAEMEAAWTAELRTGYLEGMRLAQDGVRFRLLTGEMVDSICNGGGHTYVPQLLDLIRNKIGGMDSFSQVMVAEAIATLVDWYIDKRGWNATVASAAQTATEILHGVMDHPITVAAEDEEVAWLREVLQPERIIERAQRCLARLQR